MFVGCSKWRPGDKGSHRIIQIDQDIDEKQFIEMFKNDGKLTNDVLTKTVQGSCALVLHPRSHKEVCRKYKHITGFYVIYHKFAIAYTHIIDGKVETGTIKPYEHPCTSRLIIFIPIDSSIKKALVIPKNPHNHPRFQHIKPSLSEKKIIEKAVHANQKTRTTVKSLRTSATTAAILEGEAWESALPGAVDNQLLRKFISKIKKDDFPRGLGWEGS